MDKKEFEFLLKQGEGLRLEFKEGKTGIDKDIVAFANTEGGRIFLGVNDEGRVLGAVVSNKLKSELQTIARNCDPSIKIGLEEFENLIIVRVDEGEDKPYKCKEGFFMRIGANSQKMTRDEILDLILTANKKTFDSLINEDFKLELDFDKEGWEDYLKKAEVSPVLKREELLESFGVLKGNKMNNAGVLLFAKEPQRFFPQSVYTFVVYKDIEGTDIIERKEIKGNLVEIVEEIMSFVRRYVRVAYKFTGKPQRENVYEYPLEAIREAVINSVMHKDYFESGHNNILAIFPDRIEIEDFWIKPKNFILGKTKFRRNPIITDLFYRIEFGEKIGSGIKRMEKICREENAPIPEIDVQENYFYVAFKQNPEYLELATPQVTPQVTPQAELTELEKKILSEIKNNLRISRNELAKALNIGPDTIKEYLDKLKNKKMIKRIGKTSAGHWEVVE